MDLRVFAGMVWVLSMLVMPRAAAGAEHKTEPAKTAAAQEDGAEKPSAKPASKVVAKPDGKAETKLAGAVSFDQGIELAHGGLGAPHR